MKVVMLLDNTFEKDQRVAREAAALVQEGYHLTIYCLQGSSLAEEELKNGIYIKRIFTEKIFDIKSPGYLKELAKIIGQTSFDVLHCHDQVMLHIGALIKKRKKTIRLIYDSHEMFHEWPLNLSNYSNFSLFIKSYAVRKLQIWRELLNKKHIDHLITVSDSIAGILKDYLSIKSPVLTIRNIPEFVDQVETKPLREKFHIPPNKKVLLFIARNVYIKSQNLSQVINEIGNHERMALIIISSKSSGRTFFEKEVTNKNIKNIFFHDLIPSDEIINYLSDGDIGLLPYWNKTNLSYWYALPNKLFDYIMAEIPILSTCQPEFSNIIDHYEIGLCINPEEKNAFKNGYDQLQQQYSKYKNNMHKAKKSLNWEQEKKKLVNLYGEIKLNIGA